MIPRVVSQKYTVVRSAGLGTKNDCAGEDQQSRVDIAAICAATFGRDGHHKL
jgi:hypothetical protein